MGSVLQYLTKKIIAYQVCNKIISKFITKTVRLFLMWHLFEINGILSHTRRSFLCVIIYVLLDNNEDFFV